MTNQTNEELRETLIMLASKSRSTKYAAEFLRQFDSYTNQAISDVLDRLLANEPKLSDMIDIKPESYDDTLKMMKYYTDAIEQERNKLKEVSNEQ